MQSMQSRQNMLNMQQYAKYAKYAKYAEYWEYLPIIFSCRKTKNLISLNQNQVSTSGPVLAIWSCFSHPELHCRTSSSPPPFPDLFLAWIIPSLLTCPPSMDNFDYWEPEFTHGFWSIIRDSILIKSSLHNVCDQCVQPVTIFFVKSEWTKKDKLA